MSDINFSPVYWLKKINASQASFGKEITAALVLKFLLLLALWWLFFKSHKQPVDGDIIAAKLFGNEQAEIQLQNKPGKPL